jgi:hypothetical protein
MDTRMSCLHAHADLPGGNASLIRVGEAPPSVSFMPGPKQGPEALWFHLRIENRGCSTPTVELRLEQPGNLLGGRLPARIRPVIRVDGEAWGRLEPGRTVVHADGCETAVWTLPTPVTGCDIAFCYPYGEAELNALVADLPGWIDRTIGVSENGRAVRRLANRPGDPAIRPPGVFLLARQHSGETPGSWVLDGFLRRIQALGDSAPVVWAVPFVDADGVADGHYGKDRHPWDFNRAWTPNAMRHEVVAVMKDAQRFASRCRPMLMIDLHAPGGFEDEGCYVFLPKAQDLPAAHATSRPLGERLLAALGPDAHAQGFHTASYWSRWPTPNAVEWFSRSIGCPAMTLETPYQASQAGVFTIERYRDVGARLADALADFGTQGPPSPP